MNNILDFSHFNSQGKVVIDNGFVKDDENLMERGSFFGFDNIINEWTFFEIHSDNLRDSVVSAKSRTINRMRQLIVAIAKVNDLPPETPLEQILRLKYRGKRILLLEHNSAFASIFVRFCQLLQIELITSEFFGDQYASGEYVNSVLNVDIQKTHFPDNHIDLIVHTDVFEHVPDAPQGEAETVRILKPGGAVVFTAPFDFTADQDDVYAEISDGNLKMFKDPIYHDDPISADGKCLVFRIFSYPETRDRFDKLGCDYYCNYVHSTYLGILGNNAFCFIARKRGGIKD